MTIDTENPEFKNALHLMQFTSQSVFLTGKAGTGKSTFLRYLCEHTKKKHVVLAPTGIAAINAGGCTLHSFFHLPFHPFVPDDSRFNTPRRLKKFLKYNKAQIKLIKELDLIIIDEISMVRVDIIDMIDRILRTYCGNFRQPFAGKQMLFVGDVFQLEPVVTKDEGSILRNFYTTNYFFSARAFQYMPLVSIELTKVYRQSDQAFVSVLNHIRTNNITGNDLQLLNACVSPMTNSTKQDDEEELDNDEIAADRYNEEPDFMVTLAARRDVVDRINQDNLNKIEGEVVHFHGCIAGDFPQSSLPTLLDLELKVGAQIIFVKNDPDRRFVNGTIGIITDMGTDDSDTLSVLTDSGVEIDVERARWANVRYTYNETEKKIEEEELGVFTQFPIRLAWSITIHKSQGLTFNKVNIDLSGGVFAGGQTYVALSRCRSLDGLRLMTPLSASDVFVNPIVVKFSESYNDQKSLETALKRASADIEYADTIAAFDKGDFELALSHFFKAIHARYDIERPWAIRYIRRKLGIINKQKAVIDAHEKTIADLRLQLHERQETMNTYATEYFEMAKSSIDFGDNKSALKNYDKAIDMNPRYTDAYVEKGRLLLEEGKLTDALHSLNQALNIIPTHFKALYNRGKTLFRMQEYELASSDLERCTSLKEENISSHKMLGDIYSAMEREEEAAIQYAIADQLKKRRKKE